MQEKSTDKLQHFAWRLHLAAEQQGLSQAEIARRLNVKPPRVGNWFQGRNKPRPQELLAMAILLRVEASWLSTGIEGTTEPHRTKQTVPSVVSPGLAEAPAKYGEPRAPSTRADCERYFRNYLDRAAQDGDPDNFPAIMRRLKDNFKPGDWSAEP